MKKIKQILYFIIIVFCVSVTNVSATDTIKKYPVPDVEKHCYSTTVTYNKYLYDNILNGLINLKDEVDTSMYSKNSDEVFKVLEKVLDDHPEIFYFDYEKSSFWSNGVLELGYKENKTTINTMKQQLNSEVQSIINNVIKEDMSDLEKEMAIHDYIVLNTKYDVEGVDSASAASLIFTSYGCLVNNLCVCDGYAKAMQLLLNKVGVYTIRITGKAGGENHAWNIVRINGKNYHVDATWNDPVPDSGYVRYAYFNMSDADIAKNHSWVKADFPACYNNSFRYLHKASYVVKDSDYIYYSNEADENVLYKMRLDGSENKRLSEDTAINLAYYDDYIYFSNYSDGGNLYRINKDENDLEKILDNHVENIHVVDGYLTYYNEDIGRYEKIKLEDYVDDGDTNDNDDGTIDDGDNNGNDDGTIDDGDNNGNDDGSTDNGDNITENEEKFREMFKDYKLWGETKTVPSNKVWKVSFNRELVEQSIEERVYVLDGSFNKVTDIDVNVSSDGKTIIVTKKDSYKRGTIYYLVISNPIKDNKGNEIKEPVVMKFKVY